MTGRSREKREGNRGKRKRQIEALSFFKSLPLFVFSSPLLQNRATPYSIRGLMKQNSIHVVSIMTTAERPRRSSTELLTIGHSNLPLETLIELLQQHQVEVLADIRRFPGSRTFPQFNQTTFAAALQAAGIEYRCIEKLGGRRPLQHLKNPSLNIGLHNASFRNYGDYMQTPAFREGFAELMEIVHAHRTAIMCSESVYWRCHRRLVSDYATAAGLTVQHIFSNGTLRPHQLTAGALLKRKRVTYPGLPME